MSEAIEATLQEVFRKVFDDPELLVESGTTADDVEGWDSLTHINLIVAVEKQFRVRFTTAEVRGMRNVGDLAGAIARKLG